MMKRLDLIAVCLILLLPAWASADTPIHPRSYAVATPDGKFVFVMIAPVSAEEDGSFEGPEKRAESQRVRAKYSASGLYLNDGSTEPLWVVDWYAHFVLVPSDGEHVIRRGYWTESLNDEALTFFNHGKEIRSYRVGDLFYTSQGFPRRMEQFYWHGETNLDEAAHTLTLTTTLKDKYVFDYTSGELLNSRSPMKALLVAGVIIIAAGAAASVRRRRVRKRAA